MKILDFHSTWGLLMMERIFHQKDQLLIQQVILFIVKVTIYQRCYCQATADYSYQFFHVAIRWPGSVHGTKNFKNSSHKNLRNLHRPLKENETSLGEATVPYH